MVSKSPPASSPPPSDAAKGGEGNSEGNSSTAALVPSLETNERIVRLFRELEETERGKGDTIRANSYKKGAQSIADLASPLVSGRQAMQLPGVGKKMGAKVDEILTTGTLGRIIRDRQAAQ